MNMNMNMNKFICLSLTTLPLTGMASTTLQGDLLQDSKKLSLENHYTLYDLSEKHFIFGEVNVHRLYANNAYVGNLGMGYRTITTGDNAVGINAFYDQGFSKNNPNGYSFGFEYLRNVVYLNTNFYFKGRENWKESGDYKFNNAFDINAQYYIPQTPLSLKASYIRSQKEANLIIGKDERAKGMYKMGMEATPVQLISIGYSYNRLHAGSSKDENQVYMKLTYNFDQPLDKQLEWNTNNNDFVDFVRNRKVERNLILTTASENDFIKTQPEPSPNLLPEWEIKDFKTEEIKKTIAYNGCLKTEPQCNSDGYPKGYDGPKPTLIDLAKAKKGSLDYLKYLKELAVKGGKGAPTITDIAQYKKLNNL